jgi:apolipoprotein N-acyltransferase
MGGAAGLLVASGRPVATATAVLVQPNLDVAGDNRWSAWRLGPAHCEFTRLAGEQCKTYIAGIPQTGASNGEIVCPPYPTHPDLVVWPESPAPFEEADPRFQQALKGIAHAEHAPWWWATLARTFRPKSRRGTTTTPPGHQCGRSARGPLRQNPPGSLRRICSVSNLLFFARKLTGKVSRFTRGDERKVFTLNGHRYGVFICYESVFADEVREFAKNGAEVLVNISDDGWYGDTSAPWQHLNMARMRAIENRRWILRDTNTGITAVIDPYGRVRQSIPRHQADALPAQFGFRDDVTFYTAHGDVFGWA